MTAAPHHQEDVPKLGDTSPDRITAAAIWLADLPTPPVPLVPELQRRFDLNAKDACEVCALAGKMRMLRMAHA